MKKIGLLAFLLGVAVVSSVAQEHRLGRKKVPKTIQNFLMTNYPRAKHIRYYEEKNNGLVFIEAEFYNQRVEYSLKFCGDSLVEVEREIPFTVIPANEQSRMREYMSSKYGQYRIMECQEVNPDTNPLYEIKIKTSAGNFIELYFDKLGVIQYNKELMVKPIPSQF